MRKKKLKSWISFALVVIMIFQLLPSMSLDGYAENEVPDNKNQSEVVESEPYIVAEIEELRDEAVKHYRMSDGSFSLVEYDAPMHYKDDGQWKEIDNTLISSASKYVAENGDVQKVFSATLADGELFELSYGEYNVAMSLVESKDSQNNKSSNEKEENDEHSLNTTDLDTDSDNSTNTDEQLTASRENNQYQNDQTESFTVNETWENYVKVEATDVCAVVDNPKRMLKAPGHNNQEIAIAEMSISKVSYKNALNKADLVYSNHGNNIKESIIINSKSDSYVYSFGLDLSGLTPTIQDDGSVNLSNGAGEVIFRIPTPWMMDANGITSDKAKYTIQQTNLGLVLSVQADAEWLNAPERAFPVTLDPTLELSGSSYIQTACTYEGSVLTPNRSSCMHCGYSKNESLKTCVVYMQVMKLPTIPEGCAPISVSVGLGQLGLYDSNDTNLTNPNVKSGKITIAAHPSKALLDNISELTSVFTIINTDKTVLDFQRLTGDTVGKYVYWDITAEAMDWFTNNNIDSGIILRPTNGENELRLAVLGGSGDAGALPYFVVSYRNIVGIEDYYTYQEASAGRAGEIYVSDFTTQLTAVHEDLTYSSEVTPFVLNHVYNSALANQQFTDGGNINTCNFTSMKGGCGWKLSAQQTVVAKVNSGTNYLIYNDGDGTEHYFRETSKNSNVYEDEDGLNLKIEKKSSSDAIVYTMTDKGAEHTWIFHNGYLVSQMDSVGNAIYIAYNNNYNGNPNSLQWKPGSSQTNNRIVQIVSVPSGKSASIICELNYSGNELVSVRDYAGREIVFSYATESGRRQLKSIRHQDSTYSNYTYDATSGRMSSLFDDEAKYGIGITQRFVLGRYATNQISEFTADSIDGTRTVGNAFHAYRNSPQMTSYRFYGPDHTSDTSDDIVAYYMFDNFGRTICAYNTNYSKRMVIGATAAAYTKNDGTKKSNNRLTGATSMGMEPSNMLLNPGAEPGSAVWLASISGSASVSSEKTRTGQGALRCSVTSSSASASATIQQTVLLKAFYTYTLTGYINTSGITDFSSTSGGAYLAFLNGTTGLTTAKKSDIINYTTSESGNSDDDNIDMGWEKVTVSFTPAVTGYYGVAFVQKGAKGVSYCDDLQLDIDRTKYITDVNPAAASVNLVPWDPANWSGDGFTIEDELDRVGEVSAETTGDIEVKKRIQKTVSINKPAKNLTFILSGWAKAHSIATALPEPTPTNFRYFGLIAIINYTDGTKENHYVSFNKDCLDWQYTSGIVVPKEQNKTISTIDVIGAYDHNRNTARFNNISFVREPVQTYTYDSDGKPIAATDGNAKTECTYVENSNRLSSYTTPNGNKHTLTYTNNHLLETDTIAGSFIKQIEYDSTGNAVSQKISDTSNGAFLKAEYLYSADRHFRNKETSVDGRITEYTYDNNYRTLSTTKQADGTVQNTQYDKNSDRLKSIDIGNGTSLEYGYQNGTLSSLNRASNMSNQTFSQEYVISADKFGNLNSVGVRGSSDNGSFSAPIVLVSYEYENDVNNGRLSKMTYANGDTVEYSYDIFDRVKKAKYKDGMPSKSAIYNYQYDAEGNIVEQEETNLAGTTRESYSYQYDSLSRLIHSRKKDGLGNLVLSTSHVYDTSNRLITQRWQFDSNDTYYQRMSYNNGENGDGTLESMTIATPQNGSIAINYSYNKLRQLTARSTNIGSSNFTRNFSYLPYDNSGTRMTALMGETNYTFDGTPKLGYTYEYDNMSRITAVHKNDSPNSQYLTYAYDSQGQLSSAADHANGLQYTYSYDTAGNLRSKIKHPTNGGNDSSIEYSYDNGSWKDLLTSVTVNGTTKELKYPTQSKKVTAGTPLSWYNGNSYTLTWCRGTYLETAKNGLSAKTSYEYDMAGVRSSKTVGLTEYKFTTLSGLVMRQEWGSSQIDFIYDDSNQPYAFTYKSSKNATPVTYYYLLNQQGDIEAIMNATGTIVVRYEYDPWGAVTVKKGDGTVDSDASSIGNINPLRYRGYYYDTETGFYYLQSRYYDPVIGRFISADTFATTDVTGVLSANMFAYCKNNPVQYEDKDGNSATLAGAVVGGVWGTISGMAAGLPLEGVFQYAVSGALTGAAAGFVADLTVATCGAGAAMLWSALGSGTMNVVNSFATHNIDKKFLKDTSEYTFADKAIDFLVGGLTGGLFAGMSAKGPVVKGIKTGLSHVKNMITTELFQFSMGLNKMFIKAFSFDFVSSFLGAISNWFGTNHLKHQYVGSGTRGHR